MPRLLRFTFCFLLFVAQLAPSLPSTDRAARLFPTDSRTTPGPPSPDARLTSPDARLTSPDARAPAHRLYRPPEPCFFVVALLFRFLTLSRCIRVEFPELKAPPSRLNIFGSEAISGLRT